jgi:hypothetical protein
MRQERRTARCGLETQNTVINGMYYLTSGKDHSIKLFSKTVLFYCSIIVSYRSLSSLSYQTQKGRKQIPLGACMNVPLST